MERRRRCVTADLPLVASLCRPGGLLTTVTVLTGVLWAASVVLGSAATAAGRAQRGGPAPPPVPGGATVGATVGAEGETSRERGWPVRGAGGVGRPRVVRTWDPPATPWAAGHRGVDLATRAGAPVRAAAGGLVTFAGSVAGRGVVVVTLPRTGDPPLRTTYEPVRPSVRRGDRVSAGDILGTVQNGPFHCDRACLHWGLLRGERYLDPLGLLPPGILRSGHPRLLPFLSVPVRRGGASSVAGRVAATAAITPPARGYAAVITALALIGGAAWARHRLRGTAADQRAPMSRHTPGLGLRFTTGTTDARGAPGRRLSRRRPAEPWPRPHP